MLPKKEDDIDRQIKKQERRIPERIQKADFNHKEKTD